MAQTQEANLLRHLRKLVTAQRPSQQTDQHLLQQFIADADEAAFAALVQRHGTMVLGVCRSVLRHQQNAEDALQATFLVLARKAHSIRKQQSVGSWLHGVAYRLALKAKAQDGKRRARERPAAEPVAASLVDDLTVRELQAILHDELQRLPEKYRSPLLLCYWEGKTRGEAAEQLGWTKGTFKEQLERARNLLRSRLTRRGLAPSAAHFAASLTQNAAQATISGSMVQTTTQAALAFATGKTASVGLHSATAMTLAEGVIRTMQITKWATTALILIFLSTLGSGIGFLATRQADAQTEAVAKRRPKQKEESTNDGQPKAAGKDAAKEELRKLQGIWEVKAFEYQGVSKAAGPYAYRFAGEKFTFERDGKILYQGTVKLVPGKEPKIIDLVILEGEGKEETNLGLYQLEGDALKIAFNPGAKERPKELKTGAGSDTKIWHYQRKNLAPPPKAEKPIDPQLLVKLGAQLRSKDWEERSAAVAALAKLLADKRGRDADFGLVIEPLFGNAGWGGQASDNARSAEDSLVRIGAQATPLLRQRLKSADTHDRRVAAELLVRIGPPDAALATLLRPLLTDQDGYVRKAAIDGLGIVGSLAKEAVDDLDRLATNDPILPRRVAARFALIQIAGASEERIRALAGFLELKEPCDGAAAYAASALGRLGAKAKPAAPQLLAALKHMEHGVRISAAHALGEIGVKSPPAVKALIDLLVNDPEREARRCAAASLGNFGPEAKAAIPALRAALNGDAKGGWWVAADALGKIGGAEVVPVLIEALANPDDDIRYTSMKALGNLGVVATPAVTALDKASQKDPRPNNRAAAAEAVRKIEQAVQKMNQDLPTS